MEHSLAGMAQRIKSMASDFMSSLCSRSETPCPPFIRITYRNQPLQPHEIVRDVLGKVIWEGQGPALGILLVFDPWPHANWGHVCWVAGVEAAGNSGTDWWQESEFPPREDDMSHLVPCATYQKNGELEWYYPLDQTSE